MEYGRIIRYSGGVPVGRYTTVLWLLSFFFVLGGSLSKQDIYRHFVEMKYYEKIRFCFSKNDDVCRAYVYCSLYEYVGRIIGWVRLVKR